MCILSWETAYLAGLPAGYFHWTTLLFQTSQAFLSWEPAQLSDHLSIRYSSELKTKCLHKQFILN
ncbi:MAG: hypothetical protein C5B47_05755 [Verrucomicrobia bacterium]|nr:MAG: hypothetical protein C5B47_05755 [Verrucomicrobiota bacterium]